MDIRPYTLIRNPFKTQTSCSNFYQQIHSIFLLLVFFVRLFNLFFLFLKDLWIFIMVGHLTWPFLFPHPCIGTWMDGSFCCCFSSQLKLWNYFYYINNKWLNEWMNGWLKMYIITFREDDSLKSGLSFLFVM